MGGNMGMWLGQIGAIIRLEMRKTFFAKRGLWVYLLALAPALLYLGHSIEEMTSRSVRREWAKARVVPTPTLRSIQRGMKEEEVLQLAGEPHVRNDFSNERFSRADLSYTDSLSVYRIIIINGEVVGIDRRQGDSIAEDTLIFAGVFQTFYLRLAIFFGCLGVFMNSFRGELLDKSLHYYLLSPIRREVLAIGKYTAGLIATVTIFTASTALQVWMMSLHWEDPGYTQYMSTGGWGHVGAYLGVTVMACIGYGSVFLFAGLIGKNPLVTAGLLLVWESLNPFLPALLKKFSVIYYLQSLCPVTAPPDEELPELLKLLISPPEPVSTPVAIAGLLALTVVVLYLAGRRARRLEINYGTE